MQTMKRTPVILYLLAILMLLLLCACNEDNTECPCDGDSDALEAESETESSAENDNELVQDPLCYSRAEAEISGDFSDFEDACLLENNGMYVCCARGAAFLNGNGEPDGGFHFCEESDCGSALDLFYAWPGPGFGLVSANGSGNIPTGWSGADCEGDPEIVWTDETKAAIADRTLRDTDCATITDAFTCATTHNPPAHCAMIIGWPLIFDGNECQVDSGSCSGIKGALFIGCRQEYEPGAYHRLGLQYDTEGLVEWEEWVVGAIRNKESNECVGYDGLDTDIPPGWELDNCEEICTAK